MDVFKRLLWTIICAGTFGGCTHDTLKQESPPTIEDPQQETTTQHPLTAKAVAPAAAPDPNWRQQITAEARRLNVTNIEQFDNGVFGHYKQSRVFFTTVDQIPNEDRVYWVMIKVLSEKYGCLMERRNKSGDIYRFFCRDKRSVIMRKGKVNRTLYFYGRTYDKYGRFIPIN